MIVGLLLTELKLPQLGKSRNSRDGSFADSRPPYLLNAIIPVNGTSGTAR